MLIAWLTTNKAVGDPWLTEIDLHSHITISKLLGSVISDYLVDGIDQSYASRC
jgi:hypothetical protein